MILPWAYASASACWTPASTLLTMVVARLSRDQTILRVCDQPLLALLKQSHDHVHPGRGDTNLLSDFLIVVAT
ncbi:MAG: hypothetical protein A2790_19875 [Phenylobacterium sp. RIFCSPHIGHO2_01_FULL_69_31]|nr:MAG: hypothetical protein A2790_19875 [Phenylobacterium sp. RIFCSPHIGHO2_01_FULL_69_31]